MHGRFPHVRCAGPGRFTGPSCAGGSGSLAPEVHTDRNPDGRGKLSMASAVLSTLELESLVLGIFAEVTRYPLEILKPESDLEEELGIDSVKLGEVFSVLRERYD